MSAENINISIIGKGIAGLTIAIMLEKLGYTTTIYEQSETVEKTTKGTGIILACNAMQIMNKLGLKQEIETHGNIIKTMNIRAENSKILSSTDMNYFAQLYHVNTVAIHREKLHDILNNSVKSKTILGKKLLTIEKNEKNYILHFEDGTSENTNIIIGADGINSKVRSCLFHNPEARNAGQLCWRGIANISQHKNESELNEIWGRNKRFGYVRINENQIYWYALINSDSNQYQSPSIAELQNIFSDFQPEVLDILENSNAENVITRNISDFETLKNWHHQNVCLLGDAVHAMTPNLGQGACQAIEDAYVLSECIKLFGIHHAFEKYQDIRYHKAHWIVERSRKIGKMAQMNHPVSIWIRNKIMSMTPAKFTYKATQKILDLPL